MRGGIHSPILKNKTSHLIGLPLAPWMAQNFDAFCAFLRASANSWLCLEAMAICTTQPRCILGGFAVHCVAFCDFVEGVSKRILGTSREVSKKKGCIKIPVLKTGFLGFRLHQISKKQVALNQGAHILHANHVSTLKPTKPLLPQTQPKQYTNIHVTCKYLISHIYIDVFTIIIYTYHIHMYT